MSRNKYLNFNQYERDRWVEAWAAKVPRGSVVLDAGAGTGPYRPLFEGCTYISQDFAQLRPDQLKGTEGYAPIDLVCDISAIPRETASVDVILCTEVLEHVPDPMKVVAEFARILRPGGLLFLTAPLGSGIHQEPYHYYGGYTPFWYERFLPAVGLSIEELTPNGTFFKMYGQESRRFAALLKPSGFRGWRKLPAAVLYLVAVLPFSVVMPLLCHVLDRWRPDPSFTVGYHVAARRSADPGAETAASP